MFNYNEYLKYKKKYLYLKKELSKKQIGGDLELFKLEFKDFLDMVDEKSIGTLIPTDEGKVTSVISEEDCFMLKYNARDIHHKLENVWNSLENREDILNQFNQRLTKINEICSEYKINNFKSLFELYLGQFHDWISNPNNIITDYDCDLHNKRINYLCNGLEKYRELLDPEERENMEERLDSKKGAYVRLCKKKKEEVDEKVDENVDEKVDEKEDEIRWIKLPDKCGLWRELKEGEPVCPGSECSMDMGTGKNYVKKETEEEIKKKKERRKRIRESLFK